MTSTRRLPNRGRLVTMSRMRWRSALWSRAWLLASKRHLSDLAFDREAVAECHKVDRYGRRVCSVVVAGVDVCLDHLRVGLAWVFTRYAHELPVSRRAAYVDAERAARDGPSGLWIDTTVMAPWEWRRTRGTTAKG